MEPPASGHDPTDAGAAPSSGWGTLPPQRPGRGKAHAIDVEPVDPNAQPAPPPGVEDVAASDDVGVPVTSGPPDAGEARDVADRSADVPTAPIPATAAGGADDSPAREADRATDQEAVTEPHVVLPPVDPLPDLTATTFASVGDAPPPPPAPPPPSLSVPPPPPLPPVAPPPPPPPPPPLAPTGGRPDGATPGRRGRAVALVLTLLAIAVVGTALALTLGDDDDDGDEVAAQSEDDDTTTTSSRRTTTTKGRTTTTGSGGGAGGAAAAAPAAPSRSSGGRPVRYGDDATLDRFWDQCRGGDMAACDELYRLSDRGTEYEAYGDTCGRRNDPGRYCQEIYGSPTAVSRGDDPALDQLWDACAAEDFAACDSLYYQSGIGTEYERFGNTCGYRNEPDGLCADLYG